MTAEGGLRIAFAVFSLVLARRLPAWRATRPAVAGAQCVAALLGCPSDSGGASLEENFCASVMLGLTRSCKSACPRAG